MRVAVLILISLILSVNSLAQENSVEIYSGMDEATSVYATNNHLFIVESGKDRLLKLDHNGNLLETLGGLGTGDYQFDTPVTVDATNGLKIYISDSRNSRIQIYDRRFQYLGSITRKDNFNNRRRMTPTRFIVTDFGELIVWDEHTRRFLRFDENGSFLDDFELPEGLSQVDDMNIIRDQIEILDRKNQMIQLIIQNGLAGDQFSYISPGFVDEAEIDGKRFTLYDDRILRIDNIER